MCFSTASVRVFQDTSVVTPEIKAQRMPTQASVPILQPLGFAVVIGDLKHTSWYSLARLLSICLVQSALPSSTFILIQTKFQAEAKFSGKSLYSNNKQVSKKPELAQPCSAADMHQLQPLAALPAGLDDLQLMFSRLKFQHAKTKLESNIAARGVRHRKYLSADRRI